VSVSLGSNYPGSPGQRALKRLLLLLCVLSVDCVAKRSSEIFCVSSHSDFFESIDNHVGMDFVKETHSTVCYVGFLCDPCHLLWLPYVIGQTIIFLPCGFFPCSVFFFHA